MKYSFIRALTDKELDDVYNSLGELLEMRKQEILQILSSKQLIIIITKRDRPEKLTQAEIETDLYLSKFGSKIDIDKIYNDYFKYMNRCNPLKEEYKILKQEYKIATEVDTSSYEYVDRESLYHTMKSPEEIRNIETRLTEIEKELKNSLLPKMIFDIFEQNSIYELTDKHREMKKEIAYRIRKQANSNNRKK